MSSTETPTATPAASRTASGAVAALDFSTGDYKLLADSLRRIIDADINPYVDEWEEARTYPAHEVFKKLGDAGFLGLTKPEAHGGLGLDYSYGVMMAEQLGHIRCGGVPMSIGVQTDMATPALARFGSDELRAEWLAPSIAGDLVGCIGVSEEGAGSDVASVKTTARKDGGDYVIRGNKMWITNGIQGDWMCCLANTSEEGGPHRNKSLIVVPLGAKGVERSRKLHKMGMWSSDTAQIFLDDVRVPQRHLIGEEGEGFRYQMMQFQEERLWSAASGIIAMERIIGDTIEYTRGRQVFGRPILDNQVVHFRLAELQTEVEALRALIYRATERYIAGEDVTRLASMAKLKGGRLGREVADSCLQYWGGQGYMWESSVSRSMRDMRLWSIGAGADEVMLQILAKLEGTAPRA
ncbi:MAG TPA: acyl-CoA dehydrogenase family protein [Thermoanaerobaculia bacterium]|nr:acyl-CoA dehydrogenase family protein [Thermoanaerobaculia bacterium]